MEFIRFILLGIFRLKVDEAFLPNIKVAQIFC